MVLIIRVIFDFICRHSYFFLAKAVPAAAVIQSVSKVYLVG